MALNASFSKRSVALMPIPTFDGNEAAGFSVARGFGQGWQILFRVSNSYLCAH